MSEEPVNADVITRSDGEREYKPSVAPAKPVRKKRNFDEKWRRPNAIILKAFGEEKCMSHWAADPRCKVRLRSLIYRLSKGWEPEKAISQESERSFDKTKHLFLPKTRKRFGSLVVTGRDPTVHSNTHAICKCDCGKTTSVYVYDLRMGKTKSCGCGATFAGSDNGRWKGFGQIPGDYLSQIRNRARNLKRDFDLDIKYLSRIFELQERKCYFTGQVLTTKIHNRPGTASIDRIDCSKGYLKGNVRWVHKTINKMRSALRDEDFIAFCEQVANHKKRLDIPANPDTIHT